MPQIHELPNSRLVLALPLIKLSTLEETTDPPLRLSFFSYQMRFFDWIISRMPSALSPHFQHQKTLDFLMYINMGDREQHIQLSKVVIVSIE